MTTTTNEKESEILFLIGLFGETNLRLLRILKQSRGEDVEIINIAINRLEQGVI